MADTGFGKTGGNNRAAYIVAANNQNVIITVPTTILCNQHYKYFTKRFKDFNINVYQCSKIIDNIDKTQIKNGGNIIIATHKILYAKIDHTKTKMVIIDEEHHFGVTQKEKLKTFSPKCHLLLVSATPYSLNPANGFK